MAFVDPFGVKGLNFNNLASLLSVPKREALILFNDVGAKRIHAAARARPKGRQSANIDMFALLGEPADESNATDDEDREAEARVKTWQDKNLEILKDAFGDKWPEVEAELNRTDWHKRQRLLADRYVECLKGACALYVTPISITDAQGRHHYYLVHASNHPSATLAMKRAIHKVFRTQVAAGVKR